MIDFLNIMMAAQTSAAAIAFPDRPRQLFFAALQKVGLSGIQAEAKTPGHLPAAVVLLPQCLFVSRNCTGSGGFREVVER